MCDDRGPLRRRHSGIGRAVPEASPIDLPFLGLSGGIIMNTAMARRLALGDRVIWMGNDACQPNGCGTIIRITAHQVEVWEGETANATACVTFDMRILSFAAAGRRSKPRSCLESASLLGSLRRPAEKQPSILLNGSLST